MCAASVKQAKRTVRWSVAAQRALDQTMAHINAQDYSTGLLVLQRVSKVIDLLSTQPDIGTPTYLPALRRYPVPKTGHTIEYRVTANDIVIVRWVRNVRIRKT